MTMDEEMDRDLEEARPAGEPSGELAGIRAGTTYAEDAGAIDEKPRPEEAERTPAATSATDGFDLLDERELTEIRDRWTGLQATFVDDPSGAARQAGTLVGEILDDLQRRHRALLDEAGARNGADADTQALRAAFLRHRSFVRTLLG